MEDFDFMNIYDYCAAANYVNYASQYLLLHSHGTSLYMERVDPMPKFMRCVCTPEL